MIVVPFSSHSILRCFISPEEHVETVFGLCIPLGTSMSARNWITCFLFRGLSFLVDCQDDCYVEKWLHIWSKVSYNIVKTSNIFPTAKNWVKIKGNEIQLRKRKFERWHMYNMFKGRSVDLRMAVWGKWFRSWLTPCFPFVITIALSVPFTNLATNSCNYYKRRINESTINVL